MAMVKYGQKHGALLIAIEHRFYGASQPNGQNGNSFNDLSLLSVDQALADFATVIDWFRQNYNVSNVIVFGCSYIGSGAAWFRAKYPHVIAGAVASSPPVLAVDDFFKYLDQVQLSINEQVGPQCVQNIQTAMVSVNNMLLNNPSQLVSLFQLCAAPVATLDKQNFVSDLMGTVMEVGKQKSIR